MARAANDGKKSERNYAKQSGGQLVYRSGAGTAKGDVMVDTEDIFMTCEIKSSIKSHPTRGPYITLQRAWFRKIRAQALAHGREPSLVVSSPPHFAAFIYDPFTDIEAPELHGTRILYFHEPIAGIYVDGKLWRCTDCSVPLERSSNEPTIGFKGLLGTA